MAEFSLVIAQQSVYLYRLSGAVAEPIAVAELMDDPVAWVAAHIPERGNCSLVSDITDETYIRNVLPPIWTARTRQQLLQRRLIQQLRDSPYRVAVLAPSGSWRLPTRASLISIGHSERIDQWLAALAANHVRVKGLWPLSALIALQVRQKAPLRPRTDSLKGAAGAVLEPANLRPTLVLVATPAGLRQVLVRGKIPLFSRLALSVGEGSLSASFVLAEARRTIQYLISQEWLNSADEPVATQMWLPFADEQALADVQSDSALDVQFLEVVTDAYKLLLPRLRSVSSQLQFLPDGSRTQWRAAQIGSSAKYVGITALVLAGLWSADLLWQSLGKRTLARELLSRAEAINQQARQEVLSAEGDLSQAGLAVATVQAWQQIIALQPDQFAGLQHLAGGLKAAPGVEFQTMSWTLPRLSAHASDTLPVAVAPFGCPKAVGSALVAKPAQHIEGSFVPAAVLSFTATLPFLITERQALQLQENFLATLNTDGWSAYVLKSTVTLDPTQVQTGTLGKVDARTLDLCMQKAPS